MTDVEARNGPTPPGDSRAGGAVGRPGLRSIRREGARISLTADAADAPLEVGGEPGAPREGMRLAQEVLRISFRGNCHGPTRNTRTSRDDGSR